MNPASPAVASMMPNTIRYAAQDISQMDRNSATAMKKKNRLNSRMVSATRKNTLPWTPFLTSAVTSDRASSSSARSSVETCEDASRTSPPMDASPFGEVSADNGMEGSTGGTWLPGVGLATGTPPSATLPGAGSVVRATAQPLEPAPSGLLVHPALTGPRGRAGGPALGWVRGDRPGQQAGQTVPGGLPVAQLGAVLGGHHGDHAVGEPPAQPAQQPLTQRVRYRRGVGQIHRELHPGVGGVHPLPAGARGAGEPPTQFPLGEHKRLGAGHGDPSRVVPVPGPAFRARPGQSSPLPSARPVEIRSITLESARVVTSPISRFSATSLSSRRMILPDRVLGSSSTTMIWRGFAIGPISLETWSRRALIASSPLASSFATLPRRITNATMPCPVVGSDAPTTAASATVGCETSADSTSVVEMLWPDTSMMSSTRPSIQMEPSSSYLAPSPAK